MILVWAEKTGSFKQEQTPFFFFFFSFGEYGIDSWATPPHHFYFYFLALLEKDGIDSWATPPSFKSLFSHLLVMWPWTCYPLMGPGFSTFWHISAFLFVLPALISFCSLATVLYLHWREPNWLRLASPNQAFMCCVSFNRLIISQWVGPLRVRSPTWFYQGLPQCKV